MEPPVSIEDSSAQSPNQLPDEVHTEPASQQESAGRQIGLGSLSGLRATMANAVASTHQTVAQSGGMQVLGGARRALSMAGDVHRTFTQREAEHSEQAGGEDGGSPFASLPEVFQNEACTEPSDGSLTVGQKSRAMLETFRTTATKVITDGQETLVQLPSSTHILQGASKVFARCQEVERGASAASAGQHGQAVLGEEHCVSRPAETRLADSVIQEVTSTGPTDASVDDSQDVGKLQQPITIVEEATEAVSQLPTNMSETIQSMVRRPTDTESDVDASGQVITNAVSIPACVDEAQDTAGGQQTITNIEGSQDAVLQLGGEDSSRAQAEPTSLGASFGDRPNASHASATSGGAGLVSRLHGSVTTAFASRQEALTKSLTRRVQTSDGLNDSPQSDGTADAPFLEASAVCQQKVDQREARSLSNVIANARAVGTAASTVAVVGSTHIQHGVRHAITEAKEAHTAISQAIAEDGAQGALTTTAGYGAQAALTSYVVYQGAKSAVVEKAIEAGAMAAGAVTERIDPEKHKLAHACAIQVQECARIGAQHAATHGESLVRRSYEAYKATDEAVKNIVDESYRALPEVHRQAIMERKQSVQEAKESAKAMLLDLSVPVRRSIIANVGAVLKKNATSDPDMWMWMRRVVAMVMDDFWADVDVEVEKGLQLTILSDLDKEQLDAPVSGKWTSLMCCCCLRSRAFVLYHFLPCDKSIFGMLKDPAYLFFLGVTLVPSWSVRVAFFSLILTLLAVAPDGVDEYQLVSFILSTKGMQFLTAGVLLNALGSAQYYYAIHFCELSPECIDKHTPGQSEPVLFAVIDFVGSVLLVWVAFVLLPCSRKHGTLARRAEYLERIKPAWKAASRTEVEMVVSRQRCCTCCCAGPKMQGGRILRLLWWDLGCFLLCCSGLVVLQGLTGCSVGSAEFLANLYWCRVAYSMLTVPFFLFGLPGIRQVLTHAEPTGFSWTGRCVPLMIGVQRTDVAPAKQPLLGTRLEQE